MIPVSPTKKSGAFGVESGQQTVTRWREVNASICLNTLGPPQSDSAVLATLLSQNVQLFATYDIAMHDALSSGAHVLVACGYIGRAPLASPWVDLHFMLIEKMKCYHSFVYPTQPMSLARRVGAISKRIALQRATQALLNTPRFLAELGSSPEIVEFVSKPLGVAATAAGEADYCIGSTPDIGRYANLEILFSFSPNMVWALYCRSG